MTVGAATSLPNSFSLILALQPLTAMVSLDLQLCLLHSQSPRGSAPIPELETSQAGRAAFSPVCQDQCLSLPDVWCLTGSDFYVFSVFYCLLLLFSKTGRRAGKSIPCSGFFIRRRVLQTAYLLRFLFSAAFLFLVPLGEFFDHNFHLS